MIYDDLWKSHLILFLHWYLQDKIDQNIKHILMRTSLNGKVSVSATHKQSRLHMITCQPHDISNSFSFRIHLWIGMQNSSLHHPAWSCQPPFHAPAGFFGGSRKNATQSLPSSHFSHLSCKQILCQTLPDRNSQPVSSLCNCSFSGTRITKAIPGMEGTHPSSEMADLDSAQNTMNRSMYCSTCTCSIIM